MAYPVTRVTPLPSVVAPVVSTPVSSERTSLRSPTMPTRVVSAQDMTPTGIVRGYGSRSPTSAVVSPSSAVSEDKQAIEAKKAAEAMQAVEAKKAAAAKQAAEEMKAKVEALEQEKREMSAKLQEVQDERNAVQKALAEAKVEKTGVVASVASLAVSGSLPYDQEDKHIGKVSMDELEHHYDVVIIGGGPVGVAAAMKACVLGHRSIIVDKPKLTPMPDGLDPSFGGPTGLWSKALRDTGKHLDVPSLQSMHLDDEVIWHQVRNMCVRLACANANHQVKTLRRFKINYLQATATVVDSKSVLVKQEHGGDPVILQTDCVLVATGSRAMRPKEIPFDDCRIFDADTINSLSFLPKSLAVLGSGIIAIEYAKIFRKMGVKVCMIVRSECLSAFERIGLDHDIAEKFIEVLHEDDVSIYENTSITEWDVPPSRSDGPMTLKLKSKNADVPKEIQVEAFLAATGRVANTSGWGAEKLGIKLTSRGHVEVNGNYETSVPDIYAAGDVIGPPSLASTGVQQAQAAMLEMFGQGHMNKFDQFPVGMWTTPECGYYGLTQAQATKQGIEAKEGKVTYDACLRGRVFAPVGLLKLVFRVDNGVIIGVHILGDDACELVHYGMDLVKQGVTIYKVMTTCFTAVTFHELFKEAALDANSQLEFGLEWHKILDDIGVHLDNHEHDLDLTKMKTLFDEADEHKHGVLDYKEIMGVFHKYGCDIDRKTASNLVRLSSTKPDKSIVCWDDFSRIFDILEDVRAMSHFSNDKKAAEKDVLRRFSDLRAASLNDMQDLLKSQGA